MPMSKHPAPLSSEKKLRSAFCGARRRQVLRVEEVGGRNIEGLTLLFKGLFLIVL